MGGRGWEGGLAEPWSPQERSALHPLKMARGAQKTGLSVPAYETEPIERLSTTTDAAFHTCATARTATRG